MSPTATFPKSFIWGAGTSAYQIEGNCEADGKAHSIWDEFSRREGKISAGENGNIACGHYNRVDEDIGLIRQLGLGAYRFSISWPRVLPEGTGPVNSKGIGFYDRLVDDLLETGIQPWITLYHWDLPSALMSQGGWQCKNAPQWFGEFVATVHARLGDRVHNWITFNEPNIFVPFGFERGLHAPGLCLPQSDIAGIVHQVLKSHSLAASIIRSSSSGKAKAGCTLSMSPWEAAAEAHESSVILDTAEERTFQLSDSNPFKSFVLWGDALIKGEYPKAYLERFESHLPENWDHDMESLKDSVDFMGLNIYASAGQVRRDSQGSLQEMKYADSEIQPKTLFHWPVTPEALYWGPYWAHKRYGLPLVITENGMSAHDWIHLDGQVPDLHRIDFMHRYLIPLHKAIQEQIPVLGYFHWSLIDNFEWAEGYRQKFGLIHVDRESLRRTIKDSGRWYARVIEENAVPMLEYL